MARALLALLALLAALAPLAGAAPSAPDLLLRETSLAAAEARAVPDAGPGTALAWLPLLAALAAAALAAARSEVADRN